MRTNGQRIGLVLLTMLVGAAQGCGAGTIYSANDGSTTEDAGVLADATADAAQALDAAPPDGAVQVDSAVQQDAAPPDAAIPVGDFCETNGAVVMEAENYSSQNGYSVVSHGDASGGQAMQVGGSGSLSFDIFLYTAGTFYFWVRTQAPDSESNGMFVELDGTRIEAPSGHPEAGQSDIYLKKSSSQWFWDPEWQGDGTHSGPVTFTASAGPHVLSITKRKMEDPLIDKVVLTLGSTPPSGHGPGETACP